MCSSVDQVEFAEDSFWNILSDMVCSNRPYHFQFSNRNNSVFGNFSRSEFTTETNLKLDVKRDDLSGDNR